MGLFRTWYYTAFKVIYELSEITHNITLFLNLFVYHDLKFNYFWKKTKLFLRCQNCSIFVTISVRSSVIYIRILYLPKFKSFNSLLYTNVLLSSLHFTVRVSENINWYRLRYTPTNVYWRYTFIKRMVDHRNEVLNSSTLWLTGVETEIFRFSKLPLHHHPHKSEILEIFNLIEVNYMLVDCMKSGN